MVYLYDFSAGVSSAGTKDTDDKIIFLPASVHDGDYRCARQAVNRNHPFHGSGVEIDAAMRRAECR